MVRSGPGQLELQNGRFGIRIQLKIIQIWAWPAEPRNGQIWAWPAGAPKWSDLGLTSWSSRMVVLGQELNCNSMKSGPGQLEHQNGQIWAWPAGAPKWSDLGLTS